MPLGWVPMTFLTVLELRGSVMLMYGPSNVNWSISTGASKIFISWVTSPIIAGLLAAFIYLTTKFLVFKHHDSYKRGKRIIPYYFSIAVFIDIYLIMSKSSLTTSVQPKWQLIIAGICCVVSWLFFQFMMVPWMDRRV